MPAYRDEGRRTWRCLYRIRGADGKQKQYQKRGFPSRKAALDYERQQIMSSSRDMSMTFKMFFEDFYTADKKSSLKPTTWKTKSNIMETHILPVFGSIRMVDITPRLIMAWMNELKTVKEDGKKYSNEYLRTIYTCLRSVMNHAAVFYDYTNPMTKVSNFPKEKIKEKTIWDSMQYQKFASVIRRKGDDMSSIIFDTFFFSGLRISELLALTVEDVDTVNNTIRVNKNYQVVNKQALILTPKTFASDRVVPIPESLSADLGEYISRFPNLPSDARIFPVSHNFVHYRLKKYIGLAGDIPSIRVHDFRHSYVSLLLHLGYLPVDISMMVGHSTPRVVYQYSHPYWDLQRAMAQNLDKVRTGLSYDTMA